MTDEERRARQKSYAEGLVRAAEESEASPPGGRPPAKRKGKSDLKATKLAALQEDHPRKSQSGFPREVQRQSGSEPEATRSVREASPRRRRDAPCATRSTPAA